MLALVTGLVVLGALVTLTVTRTPAEAVFLGALGILMALGAVSPEAALAGFGNEAVVTIGVLYVVAAGLRETGAVTWLSQRLLGRPTHEITAQVRLMLPVAAVSGFLNNTPVVAILIPAVSEWARKHKLSPSKLMLPLSYASILGGTLTIIGTSTNLVVNGLLRTSGERPLRFFEIGQAGLPVAAAGIFAVLLLSRRLLRDRRPVLERLADPREYTVEMTVDGAGPLVGRTVEHAGLTALGDVYLIEIERAGHVLPAIYPRMALEPGDRLLFVGLVDSIVDLQRVPGLLPAAGQVHKLDVPREGRILVEAVVSDSGPLVGRSIKAGRFRTHYGAVVVAVARNGERLRQKLGDIVLRPGDTLLLEAAPDFVERNRNVRDFYLVSPIPDSTPPRFERMGTAAIVLAAMVAAVALGWLPMVTAALLAAGVLLLTRCVTPTTARRSVDWQVLLVIGAAFGLGQALETTGVAAGVASFLTDIAGSNPYANLVLLYLATAAFTAVVTNNAAAVLMFSIAHGIATGLGASVTPFAVTVMLAASASFATPIGYQTNLMVMGPGGYRFSDYLRLGVPVTLATGLVAVLLIPRIWPFSP